MSRLRSNPKKITCQAEPGAFDIGSKPGPCGDLAVIRCNACKKYFCEECWIDHFEMTVVVKEK